MTTYYKFTGEGGETWGGFRWPLPTSDGPGEWVDLHPRARGALTGADLCSGAVLHLTDSAHLLDWMDAEMYEAEVDESRGIVAGLHKFGVRRARLVRRVVAWNDRTARLFACDCAEDALQFAAPESRGVLAATIATARRYADGLATKEELDAARDAAGDAAGDAARDAAGAARDAAGDAAGAAAWDAAWDRYSARLAEMLGIEATDAA